VRRQSETATALWFKTRAGEIQSGVALRLATAPLHETARRVTFSAASSWV